MLISWAGHTDAGTLSEQLADSLLSALPHRQLASFDADALFDYRSRRPQVTFAENRFTDYQARSWTSMRSGTPRGGPSCC